VYDCSFDHLHSFLELIAVRIDPHGWEGRATMIAVTQPTLCTGKPLGICEAFNIVNERSLADSECAESEVLGILYIGRLTGSHEVAAICFCKWCWHFMPIMEISCDTLGESGDAIDHLDWEMRWIAVCAEADKWDREEVMPLASSHLKVFI
jgi:hypothetical protein